MSVKVIGFDKFISDYPIYYDFHQVHQSLTKDKLAPKYVCQVWQLSLSKHLPLQTWLITQWRFFLRRTMYKGTSQQLDLDETIIIVQDSFS